MQFGKLMSVYCKERKEVNNCTKVAEGDKRDLYVSWLEFKNQLMCHWKTVNRCIDQEIERRVKSVTLLQQSVQIYDPMKDQNLKEDGPPGFKPFSYFDGHSCEV